MNYTSLKYFLAVAQELNISKTAQQLYISQQSLSEHIVRLEQEYNVKLFERTPRLKLTYAGLQLQKLAEEVINYDKLIRTTLLNISHDHRGNLSLGVTPTHGRILMHDILQYFHNKYPQIEVNVTVRNSQDLLPLLRNRKLDLALTFITEGSSIEFEPMCTIQQRLCLIVPQNILEQYFGISSVPKGTIQVNRELLHRLPFLLAPIGSKLRDLEERYFNDFNIRPRIILETQDLEMGARFCCDGYGVFFSSELYAQYFMKNYVYNYPLHILLLEECQRTLAYYIGYHRNQFLNESTKDFIKIAKSTALETTKPNYDATILKLIN